MKKTLLVAAITSLALVSACSKKEQEEILVIEPAPVYGYPVTQQPVSLPYPTTPSFK